MLGGAADLLTISPADATGVTASRIIRIISRRKCISLPFQNSLDGKLLRGPSLAGTIHSDTSIMSARPCNVRSATSLLE